MAPKWPQVNNGPEPINEHATYLREACNQLQAVDRGKQNQVPWNIVQSYITSTITLIGKVLQQPAMSEILHHIQDAAKCTQNIQRDITVIKNSVGLSTTPLNVANFGGGRASWAQVAAQAKGSLPPPPLIPQSMLNTKAQSAVTAYKDRAVTVKLKDHGMAQRLRTLSAIRIKNQIETSIHNNTATKQVKIVAAHQLKSGDIQIFTSTTAEATQLKENREWISGLGEHAELVTQSYGVVVHGISTSSINIKDQKATIQQILADNHTVIPKAEISFIGWLTKEYALKRASSIVVEFTDPEMANAIIYAGMAWDGHIHQCQLYDRACRVKQCFRCYNYGHIGTQCSASQTCGYCTERHESKHCKEKGVEGFTPRCAVCKGAHTAWSNACPARKKEIGRVEQAKQTRSIYWHVPSKDNTTRPRTNTTRHANATKEDRMPTIPTPVQRTTQRPEKESTGPEADTSAQVTPQTSLVIYEPTNTSNTKAPPQTQTAIRARAPPKAITIGTSTSPSVEEDWATPAIEPEPSQQPDRMANPQTLATEESSPPNQAQESDQSQSSLFPLDGIDAEFSVDDADAWLANLERNDAWLADLERDDANSRVQDTIEIAPSPPTSMATDARTAQGNIYRGCRCPLHQDIYSNWPRQNAELTIAICMKTCVYCGKDCRTAAELRKHMRKMDYARQNIRIRQETKGRYGPTTPAWTPIPRPQTLAHRPDSEPLSHPPAARITRSQSFTNGANGGPSSW
jgi:hypothetical protein